MYLFLATENYEADERSAQNEEEKELQLAHRRAIKNCGDAYYPFANHHALQTELGKLPPFPARDAKAPRRVVNLPDNSLGPLFKGRDIALAELRQRL